MATSLAARTSRLRSRARRVHGTLTRNRHAVGSSVTNVRTAGSWRGLVCFRADDDGRISETGEADRGAGAGMFSEVLFAGAAALFVVGELEAGATSANDEPEFFRAAAPSEPLRALRILPVGTGWSRIGRVGDNVGSRICVVSCARPRAVSGSLSSSSLAVDDS